MPKKKTPLVKIRVLGGDREAVLTGVLPDRIIIGIAQTDIADMQRPRIQIPKRHD